MTTDKLEWTDANSDAAKLEGWDVFTVLGLENESHRIEHAYPLDTHTHNPYIMGINRMGVR